MLFESFHPKSSIATFGGRREPGNRRMRRGAWALALAVAAAAPVVSPSFSRAATMTEIDQAMLLLAMQAQTSDPDLLKYGIEQFNKGQYEEAQATLQQVKADGLPQADRDRLAESIRKVEGALAERKAARAEFELGEQAMAEKRYAEAARHYRAAAENKFADQATLDKSRSQIAVAQAAGGGDAAAPKQDLRALYRDAVADYKARRYDAAKVKFEQLQAAGYRGGLFDRRPSEFLRDISRRQGSSETAVTQTDTTTPRTTEQPTATQTETTTTTPQPTVTETTTTTTQQPTVTETTTTEQPTVVEPAETTTEPRPTPAKPRYSAKQAYEAGKAAYNRGDYAAARGFMEEARKAGYKPGLFQDSPDRFIRNIEARERRAAERSTIVAASTQEPPANGGRTTIVEETTVRTEQPPTTTAEESALRDTAQRERLVSEQRRAEAAGMVQRAQQLQQENRLAEAYALYAEAAALDPTNQDAIRGRNDTQVVAAGVADRPLIESQIQRNKIRKEIIDYRLRQAIADANAAIDANNFVAARESVEAAVVARESDPALFTNEELNRFNSMIAATRVRLERAEQGTAQRADLSAAQQAALDAKLRADAEEIERRKTVAALVRQARQLTYDRNYEQALGVINQILAIDPTNEYAIGVRQLVMDYAKLSEQRRLRERRDREFINQLNRAEEAKIPYMDILNFPTNWPDISELRDRAVLEERQGGAIDAQVQAVLDKRLPEIRFDNVALAEVVEFLRDISGANIFVNWKTLEAAGVERNAAVTARLRDVRFSKALDTILSDVGGGVVPLGYTVDEGVITISTAEDLNSNTDIQVYDIRDLLVIAPEFTEPPDFDLSQYSDQQGGRGGGGGGGGGGFSGGGGGGGGGGGRGLFQTANQSNQQDQRTNAERVQELVDEISTLVRETVDRDSWVDNGGRFGSLRFLSGQLIVTQTPENHRQIISLLDKLRETRAIQVSIETRFLTVQRNFLEDIGVDIDFFFNITDPDRWSPISVSQNNTYPTSPSSSVPGSIGANAPPSMVVQGSFLDEYQVNFLIRATQASENSTILTAPRVTVFNGQQAFVVVAQQQAYVSDLEAVTGEGVGLFNPVIGTVPSGVRLVVQPTVSADRKYVTLSLQPQVSQLIDLVDFPVFGLAQDPNVIGGGDENVFEAAVQLPIVQLTAVNTIVSVPDGGTLLLGGQTLAAEIEREQGVPILSKIPFLKRLFTNKSIAKDEQILLILVKPSIIIQREVEQQQYPLLNSRATGG